MHKPLAEPAATAASAAGPRPPHALYGALRRSPALYPLLGLVVVSLAMVFASPSFLTVSNAANILRQVSVNGLIAVGMTYVILSGGIDLSVGSVMALSGTLAAGLLSRGAPGWAALPACLGVGLAFGLFNGVCISRARMPPIIVTLATMGVARGLALMYTGGYPITGLPGWMRWFGAGSIAGVQAPVAIMLAAYAVGALVLERTPFGRHVYAIGGNEQATRLSGVRVVRAKLIIYAVSGLAAALAAVVLTSRLMSGQPNAGEGFELDAIAAVVLGGASISGGRGSLLGTLLGALLLGVLNNGLNMMGVNPYVQTVAKGLIILLAIYIGRDRGQ